MILYGNPPIALLQPDPHVLEWVRANISPTDVYDFQRTLWPGTNRTRLTFPGQKRIRPVVPNSLYWPSGASRFAVGYFFAAKSDLDALRLQARTTPNSYDFQALPFSMDDGGTTIQTNLFMLPPRPLADISQWGGTTQDGLYLLTLVDERYFWWERSTREMVVQPANPGITTQTLTLSTMASQDATTVSLTSGLIDPIQEGTVLTFDAPGMDQPVSATLSNNALAGDNSLTVDPLSGTINVSATSTYPDLGTQWIDLYAMGAADLDIGLVVDDIADAYLVPSAEITSRYEYTPLILDAIAYNVGQRITRWLDGTVRAESIDNAISDLGDNFKKGGSPQAGASFALKAAIQPNDLPSILPAYVDIAFYSVRDTKVQTCPAILFEYQLINLGLAEFAGVYGHQGKKTFHDTAAIAYDTAGNALNTIEINALGLQFSTDWYRWQQSYVDIQWAGIFVPTMSPLLDSVEWVYRPGMCSTRIQRPEWQDLTEELLHASPLYGSSIAADDEVIINVDPGTVPDADGYLAGFLASFDPITKTWTSGLPVFLRDANA